MQMFAASIFNLNIVDTGREGPISIFNLYWLHLNVPSPGHLFYGSYDFSTTLPNKISYGSGDSISLLCSVRATSHMWLLSSWNVASVTENLNGQFYSILVSLNLNRHMWFVAQPKNYQWLNSQTGPGKAAVQRDIWASFLLINDWHNKNGWRSRSSNSISTELMNMI